MNTPTMTTKGEQAKNQLIAAALAQFGEYGLHATTRDIAAQAGQNIAAITYYFGSKEDLYLACAQWIADFIGAQFRPHAEEAERLFAQPEPDRGAMRELILRACKNMIMLLTQDDTVDSIGQRNSYVKTWGCGGFLNETNIYSRGKSLCF